MQDTPKEAATGDKAARDLMLSELLQVCTPAPWRLNIYGGVSDGNGNDIRATGIALTNSEVAKNNSHLIALAPAIAAELIKERAVNAKMKNALEQLSMHASVAFTGDDAVMTSWVRVVDLANSVLKQAEEL